MSLIVKNLSVHHGAIRAINEISFTVNVGEMAAVVGANGEARQLYFAHSLVLIDRSRALRRGMTWKFCTLNLSC